MRNASANPFVKLTLFVLMIACLVTFVFLQFRINDLKAEYALLSAEVAESEERIAFLSSALETPFDDDYIIHVARIKLHLRLPNEVVYYNDLLK